MKSIFDMFLRLLNDVNVSHVSDGDYMASMFHVFLVAIE